MCRFALYLGAPIPLDSLMIEPAHSLVQQSLHSRQTEVPLNGDGFGVAWYAPGISPEPAVYKDVAPAWGSINLRHIARVTTSPCIMAHVRAATPGLPVTAVNCHPFTWDRFAFMHNGSVAGFREVRRLLRRRLSDPAYDIVQGTTDSEHLFALFTERWLLGTDPDPLERMAAALAETIAAIESLRREVGVTGASRLNLAVADGARAVVSRYVSEGSEPASSLYLRAARSAGAPTALVVSEPLNDEPEWTAVPPDHLVLIGEDRRVQVRPLTRRGAGTDPASVRPSPAR